MKITTNKNDTLSVEEISERIVDVVLQETILNKKSLLPKVKSIMKIYAAIRNTPHIFKGKKSMLSITENYEETRALLSFYKEQLQKVLTAEQLKPIYKEANDIEQVIRAKYKETDLSAENPASGIDKEEETVRKIKDLYFGLNLFAGIVNEIIINPKVPTKLRNDIKSRLYKYL